MESIRDLSDDELLKPLFSAKENIADAVLTSLGRYLRRNHSEFFEVPNWKEILLGCFGDEVTLNSSRFSLNASIPATQEICLVRKLASRPIKSEGNNLVLATTPEPSLLHPASTLRIPDEDDDLIFDIPETQHFTQKQLVDNENDDSNDSFIQVQPAEFNTWIPETESQMLDSRSNSPVPNAGRDAGKNDINAVIDAPILDDGDETDCEEEMSALNWKDTTRIPVKENRTDCGSITPDLLFEAVIGEEKTEKPISIGVATLDENLDDEIPISQVKFQANQELEADNKLDVFNLQTQLFTEKNTPLVKKSIERNTSFEDVPTQKFVHKVKTFPNKNSIFDLETQPFVFEAKTFAKSPSFEDAPTQLFKPPGTTNGKRIVKNGPIEASSASDYAFDDAPTQLFIKPSSSPITVIKADSDDDIFNRPTQKFQDHIQSTNNFNSFIRPIEPNPPTCLDVDLTPSKSKPVDDDVFFAPTQQLIIPKRQSPEDDIYFAATQRHLSSTDIEPSIYEASTQFFAVDVNPQTSHEYSPSASILNSTSTTNTTSSPSNKENHQKSNQSNQKLSAKITATPNVAQRKLQQKSTSSMDFDTPQYDFLKFADVDKIRQLDAEMNRKKAKIRFLFQDSSDESGSESDSSKEISPPKPNKTVVVTKATMSVVNKKRQCSVSTKKQSIPDEEPVLQVRKLRGKLQENVDANEPHNDNSIKRSRRNRVIPDYALLSNGPDILTNKQSSRAQSSPTVENNKAKLSVNKGNSAKNQSKPLEEPVLHVSKLRGRTRKLADTKGLPNDTLTKKSRHKDNTSDIVLHSSDSESSPVVKKRSRGQNVFLRKDSEAIKPNNRLNPVVKLMRVSSEEAAVPASKRRSSYVQPRILFTIVDPKPHSATIEMIGGVLVDSPNTCTVLVTDKVYRTCKFLSAMGCGTPIVSEAWISECAKQRRYVDPNAFILQDVMSEKRYKFNLSESLKASRENPIFVKMTFFVTPNTRPLPQELHSIITCASGHSILQFDTGEPRHGDTVIGISCTSDRDLWPKLQKRHPNILIISTEGLMLSVMQHRINFKPYKLK